MDHPVVIDECEMCKMCEMCTMLQVKGLTLEELPSRPKDGGGAEVEVEAPGKGEEVKEKAIGEGVEGEKEAPGEGVEVKEEAMGSLAPGLLGSNEDRELNKKLGAMIEVAVEGKGYTCLICGKISRDIVNAMRHSKTHLGLTHACTVCGKQFKTRKSQREHTSRVHGVKRSLSQALRVVEARGEEELEENKIDERVDENDNQSENLEENQRLNKQLEMMIVRVNTTDRSFRCQECGKVSRDKCTALRHCETHLGLTLTCTICGSKCRTRRVLSDHYARVHGVKRRVSFSCTR